MMHYVTHALAVVVLAMGCATRASDLACPANQALRCEGGTLVRCNDDGTAEVSETCPIGCSTLESRCIDPIPSNGLTKYLERSSDREDLFLGESATINTDTGEVLVGGAKVAVETDVVVQPGAPTIRVLIVRSLTAKAVVVNGGNALAIVSGSDIKLNGLFSVSAKGATAGPGSFTEESCSGDAPPPGYAGAAGGGGFGSEGGAGGRGPGDQGTPGSGGKKIGTDTLTPLRGGCDGGSYLPERTGGAGGGAVQLVSRNRILVDGVLAANGGGGFGGGGSGGGILLEAPTVHVSGKIVANGGGGGGGGTSSGGDCAPGIDGQTDTAPTGGECPVLVPSDPGGGNGAAWGSDAAPGGSRVLFSGAPGSGGGGFGRIRVNTAPGGLLITGGFSPNPSLGNLSTLQ